MEINQRFNFVEGTFDTNKGQLVCVHKEKYADVSLCFKENMNIPFARIKLHSEDTFGEAKKVQDDACNLGKEICERWNKYPELLETLQGLLNDFEYYISEQENEPDRAGYIDVARETIKKALEENE